MSENERSDIRHMINRIIDLLQKSSSAASDMGSRYSRLLQLLWHKPPKKSQPVEKAHPQSIDNLLIPAPNQQSVVSNSHVYDPSSYNALGLANTDVNTGYGNTFSWLDLAATWSIATQNNSITGNTGEMGDMVGDSGSSGFSPYDVNMNLLTDYRLINDDNATLIF